MESSTNKTTIPLSGKLDDRTNVKYEPRDFDELPDELRKVLVDRRTTAKERPTIQLLEGKYTLSTLIYLNKMSPVLKTDIYNDVGRNSGMPEKLDQMRALGLIEIYRMVHNSQVIVITDKGREVARMLEDIVDLLVP